MWIVRLALRRPYTFVVMALAIILLTPVSAPAYACRHFPRDQHSRVISLVWTYNGLQPQEMEQRITSNVERGIQDSPLMDVEHIESQSFNGIAVINGFSFNQAPISKPHSPRRLQFHRHSCGFLPPGTTPPLVDHLFGFRPCRSFRSALTSDTLSEQQLFDFGNYFIRTQLAAIPGAATPFPYGGKRGSSASISIQRHSRPRGFLRLTS